MPPLCHNVTTAGLTAIPTTGPTGSRARRQHFRPELGADASGDAKSDEGRLSPEYATTPPPC